MAAPSLWSFQPCQKQTSETEQSRKPLKTEQIAHDNVPPIILQIAVGSYSDPTRGFEKKKKKKEIPLQVFELKCEFFIKRVLFYPMLCNSAYKYTENNKSLTEISFFMIPKL